MPSGRTAPIGGLPSLATKLLVSSTVHYPNGFALWPPPNCSLSGLRHQHCLPLHGEKIVRSDDNAVRTGGSSDSGPLMASLKNVLRIVPSFSTEADMRCK